MNEEERIELKSEEFQELLGSVPHWILRWGITALAAVVVILLAGSVIFKYPDILSSQVILTGSTPPAVIVSRSSGKLKELYVSDNQEVKMGDYLAVIDNPAKTEDILYLKNYLDTVSLSSPVTRYESPLSLGSLQSLYSSFSATLFEYTEYMRLLYYSKKIEITKERIGQYEKQYQNLLNQQKLISEQSVLAQNQYRRDSLLYTKGTIANEESERSKSQYLQSLLAEENMQSSLKSMQIQITQLKESLLDIGHQDTEKSNNLHSQLNSYLYQLKTEILNWELNCVLTAPIDGRITFTNYWIENQNITAGNPVFTIVPNGAFQLIGKAMLPIARSGKVQQGQKVNIRLQNFPENEFGILRGRVKNISLTPTQTGEMVYYSVEITLNDGLITTYKKELPYLPNMQGQADIITEDLSLLERLVLPVKKILKESL